MYGILVLAAIAAVAGLFLWLRPKPIKVALVNMPEFMYAKMHLSADLKNVTVRAEEEVAHLDKYDAVLIFGMGLKWDDADREQVRALDKKGIKFISMMITNPDNDLCNIDSVRAEVLSKYLTNGGASNFRNGLNYLRKEILGKRLREGKIDPVKEYPSDVFFGKGADEAVFSSLAEYERWYRGNGMKEGAPKVALIAGFAGPFTANRDHFDAIIAGLESKGMNVYPISSGSKRLAFLEEVNPDLIVYMPHGRFSAGKPEQTAAFLSAKNVPVLAPVTITDTYESWMEDPKGMVGGFMSQSVVTPEIDGAIVPFALVALEEQPNGIKIFKAIPDRLEQFTRLAANYIKLRKKPNSEKKVAIYYFKGPGQNAMVAQGIEVVPSLYNVLLRLKAEGYKVEGLPATASEFGRLINTRGVLFNSYAEGNKSRFLESDYPAFVSADTLRSWMNKTFTKSGLDSIRSRYGKEPGEYFTLHRNGCDGIAVTRVEFGNVVLLPQPGQGAGTNDFNMVHGSTSVPAYPFIASYLWTRNQFKADAIVHFGTHGSLEFIPGKAVALSSNDYTDRLIYDLPHIYYYTIANVGESMMAKRRSYGQLVSYLAPPFMATEMENGLKEFNTLIENYLGKENEDARLALQIKKMAVAKGYHRDLKLDADLKRPYQRKEIELLASFIEELAKSKITGGLYTTGVPFASNKITSSVQMLSVDPVAHALACIDKQHGKVTEEQLKNDAFYAKKYLRPAEAIVRRVQSSGTVDAEAELRRIGLTEQELALVAKSEADMLQMQKGMNMMMAMMAGNPSDMTKATKKKGGGHPAWLPKIGKRPEYTKKKTQAAASSQMDEDLQEKQFVEAVLMFREALSKITFYTKALQQSPLWELDAFVNALSGGFTPPSPGGDYIASPASLPTGRNLFAINPETTPTAKAWNQGKQLGDALLVDYKERNNGKYPQKVGFSLWSSSFIESEGATIAEILYLLGVRPTRDRMGRVLDVELIPEEELGRPRIDVVVQTSGQLRDLAASRLFLIQKAVALAADAPSTRFSNNVVQGVKDAEKHLLDKGVPPAQARSLSKARVFGGLNGSYGTGIQGMVESGDKWETEKEIASTYMNNMGAIYGSNEEWGAFTAGAFEAALKNTDAVVQPRQSNTWGALSLDHVYEFMGGLTLAAREVTGKDPEGYFSDLRNRNRVRTQEIKQAIGVEARTTILNPAFMREQLKEGATAANALDETIRNTYGWNVMKPSAIDDELWNDIYDMFVQDKHQLGVVDFFKKVNPAALQDYTATMLETVRKGMWKASPEQVKQIARLHVASVTQEGAGCSGMVCDNKKLRDFIVRNADPATVAQYRENIAKTIEKSSASNSSAKVLKKEGAQGENRKATSSKASNTAWILTVGALGLLFFVLFYSVRNRKRNKK